MAYMTILQREKKRERDRVYQAKRRAASKSQFATAKPKPLTKFVMNPTPPSLAESPLINHVALVLDGSGSMSHLRDEVVKQLNAQILNIKNQAYNSKQRTYVSVYTFSGYGQLRTLAKDMYPEAMPLYNFYDFNIGGQTALLDTIDQVATNLAVKDTGDKNTTFLMIVLTDGQENDSRRVTRSSLQSQLTRLQGTDRWTFAMLMPPGGKSYALSLGIPVGNIQEWEGTKYGLEQASYSASIGTQGYYTARSMGKTSTQAFFTDLSMVQPQDLKKLNDLTHEFKRWTVKAECPITEFVQIEHNRTYEPGKAFYQLTKPEEIQPYKELVIEDRNTKQLFGGDQARRLIGISTGTTAKVKPGNHANFNLFVQSTSMNRKLVRGTTVLYRTV